MNVKTDQLKKPAVWTVMQISFASYFAGPMAGCYLLSQNCKTLDQPELSKKCLWIGVGTTVALLMLLMIAPSHLLDKMPKFIIPIAYTAFITSYAEVYQKEPVKEVIRQGGKKQGILRLLLTMLGLLIVQLTLFLLIGYLAVSFE